MSFPVYPFIALSRVSWAPKSFPWTPLKPVESKTRECGFPAIHDLAMERWKTAYSLPFSDFRGSFPRKTHGKQNSDRYSPLEMLLSSFPAFHPLRGSSVSRGKAPPRDAFPSFLISKFQELLWLI